VPRLSRRSRGAGDRRQPHRAGDRAQNAKPGNKHTLLVNAFTFFDRPLVGFKVELLVRHERAEKLYFDLLTPLEVATA
jgi:hypothetical protein